MSEPLVTLCGSLGLADGIAGGMESMSVRPSKELARRRRRRHRRPRHGHGPESTEFTSLADSDPQAAEAELLEQMDESLLAPDERAYLEARRTAEKKVGLYREVVKIGLVAVPLLIFIPFLGAIVLFFGGIKLGRQFYRLIIEPGLRDRLVREEVSKRVALSVHQERQVLEGAHARSLEELSASIAHEIRNPITAAKSLVQQMEEDPSSGENVEYARVALGELERVEKSIAHLLRFARDEDLRLQSVRMADVLDSALETFRDRSARGGVEIVRRFDSDGVLEGDPEKLRRVIINLMGNAIDALEEAGVDKPIIDVAMGENLAGTEVWVRIRDNGPGIDDETSRKIFNPFFTSKQGGTGLGLPITKKLVEAHHGSIELSSDEKGGAEFVLTFPKRRKAGNGPGGVS